MTLDELFKKWTLRRKGKNSYIVRCKKGLWRVEAKSLEVAEREAKHYFVRYLDSGEYTGGQQ